MATASSRPSTALPASTPLTTYGANGIGDHYELRTDVGGQTTRLYYYAGSQRIAVRENGTLFWLLSDHLGSTSLVTTSAGALSAEFRYKAFGETRYEAGAAPTDFQYTGQRVEDLLGLYFYRARWYDPALGRFIQADTIVPSGANPAALDRYAYVFNNPLRYVDPSGQRAGDSWILANLFALILVAGGAGNAAIYQFNEVGHSWWESPQYAEATLEEAWEGAVLAGGAGLVAAGGAAIVAGALSPAQPGFDQTAKEFVHSAMEPGDVDLADEASDLLPEPIPAPGSQTSQPPEYPLAPEGSKGTLESPFGFPADPAAAPADDYKWRTNPDEPAPPGSRHGNWWKEATGEWFHWEPDSPSHGPHWDYRDPWARRYWIYPDGTMRPKLSLGGYAVD